jgi:Mg/Co/Ni transporter MgtE
VGAGVGDFMRAVTRDFVIGLAVGVMCSVILIVLAALCGIFE